MPTLIDRAGPIEDRWSPLGAEVVGRPASGSASAEAPSDGAPSDEAPSDGAPSAGSSSAGSGSHLILSLEQWAYHGEALLASGAKVGIRLDPSEGPESIAHLLDRISLVAVNFPSFTDGRGYSTARLLRQRYGWTGELRAVGDVLRDQMFYLSRCGFDTFELKDGESVADALAGFRDFTEVYQEASDRGPLFRRRSPASPPGTDGSPETDVAVADDTDRLTAR